MKTSLWTALFLLAAAILALEISSGKNLLAKPEIALDGQASDDVTDAQPKLVRVSATCDGSGRIIFTRSKACYEHKHWTPPSNVLFDGAPWSDLAQTPAAWGDYSGQLDLTKAWIVKRKGRDVVALENTPDGFDLYFSDSPDGAANYEVTIAIPRRK